jgi:hypothetical protein
MKKCNAQLLGAVTRNFEYSKIRQKIRVSSTRYSTMESLLAMSDIFLFDQLLLVLYLATYLV